MGIQGGISRVVFTGSAPGGEIFQWGFWINGTANSAVSAGDLADQVGEVWDDTDVRLALVNLVKNDSQYTGVKVYCYPSGGPEATYVGERAITVGGGGQGSGSGNGPLYQCMVVTLHTALSGRSYRGRLYLPASGTTLDTNHRFTSSDLNDVGDAVKALLDGVNTIDVPVSVRVGVESQFLEVINPVTRISVDSKPDVQRRRENRMMPGTTVDLDISA